MWQLYVAMLVVFLSGFVVGADYMSTAHPHLYGSAPTYNAGLVLWDCGPGVEWRGTPGFFMEGEC